MYYNGSPSKALQSVYPEHNWMPWKFGHAPKGFWEKHENQREFFDWLGNQLGYHSMDDWYNVTQEDIHKHGGKDCCMTITMILHQKHFNQCIQNTIGCHGSLDMLPKDSGRNMRIRRQFFKWLGNQLGYHSMDDWYNVTEEDIHKHGGGGLLNDYYNNSPSKALQSVYPEHNWMPWKFGQAPKGFREKLLHDPEEKKKLLHWLSDKLSIRELDDWYRVSLNQIRQYYELG